MSRMFLTLKKILFIYLIISLIQFSLSKKDETDNDLKFLSESLSKTSNKIIDNGLEDFSKKLIFNTFFAGDKNNTLIKHIENKASPGTYKFNITDESINTILFMAQRSIPINIKVKNDSSLGLPIGIDTASLSLIIPELSENYPENTNMTITVYENSSTCKRPILDMAIDGVYLDVDLGLKFGVYNKETKNYDEIIDILITTEIKNTIFTENNLLNIFVMKANISKLKFNNNKLGLNEDDLLEKLNGFLRVIISQTRDMLTNIDILKYLNDLTHLDFSNFDMTVDVGYAEITIS